ncbi:PREDICTED: uncharacterized protein LOC109182538 [Ipomoea nil]|uniref:uncharacterized protein LOC109182538 n=1 Tax=Ipomoea nil TaxID=35883 RepID=UPI0009011008|nr:PREDICTED: uncharacterized protein LOC109182538 [Ipomoea nil]
MSARCHQITVSFVILTSLAILSSASDGGDDFPSVYEVIESFDFPRGILPVGITGYDIDWNTGKFDAYLKDSCSFSLEGSYQLKYKSRISGYIQKDRITNLSGVSVKVFFLWLNIVEVIRSGNDLQFSVGIASASFSLDNFLVSPRCGCGLDCKSLGNEDHAEIRSNPFVSSI